MGFEPTFSWITTRGITTMLYPPLFVKTMRASHLHDSLLITCIRVHLTNTLSQIVAIPNRTGGMVAFRVSVAIAGAVDAAKQYLYYDVTLTKNNTFVATIGITLGAADVVRVHTDTAGVSFNLFGVEVS